MSPRRSSPLRAVVHPEGAGHRCLADRVEVARGFAGRLRGRMGRPPLAPGEALLLRPCSAVHTCFCRGAMDLVFLSGDGRVAAVVAALPPWRWAACPGAAAVLELAAGAAAGVRAGDRVTFTAGEA